MQKTKNKKKKPQNTTQKRGEATKRDKKTTTKTRKTTAWRSWFYVEEVLQIHPRENETL